MMPIKKITIYNNNGGVRQMLRIAVIGLGDISDIHIPIIQDSPHAKLVAVCDIDQTKETIEGATFYTDYEEMLEREALDCVHVCLPHHLHYIATKACVEKGIHVFQEKPLAHNLEESRQLVQLEEEHPDVNICICFQNRFNETFEKLLEIVASGKYGHITGVKGLVTWYRPKSYYEAKPWRGQMKYAGGGVMINQSIHTLDLIQLLGGDIKSMRGSIDYLADYGLDVEDTATAKINFKNGATGLFFATVVNSGNSSVELQVTFEKGKFTIKNSILTKMNDDVQKVEIIEDAKLPGSKFYYGASHAKLINHFYTCLKEHTDSYIYAKDGLIAMKMIDAIYKSSQKEQKILF